MKISLDTKKLCTELKCCDATTDSIPKHWNSDGEKYLYENIVRKCVYGIPFTVADIDFSAFDEDDIVDIIDNQEDEVEKLFFTVAKISEIFEKSKPLVSNTKRFF